MSFTTSRPASWHVCPACENETLETDPAIRCPACQGLLEVRHRAPDFPAEVLKLLFETRYSARPDTAPSGVWRFRELIMPSAGEVISWPEGNTPLVRRPSLSRFAGIDDLAFKHEGLNPTGSFKDRGMTVGITQARRLGVSGVICASTGNTSASLAAYAATAGIPAFVLVPEGKVAPGKLAQAVGYGARVLAVRGDFDACLKLVEASAGELGLYPLNSVNPWRLEGQKTIVLELLLQLGWDPPDWIALPGGNLGNTSAFGKALEEAAGLGLLTRMPRLLVVQAEGASPFARAWRYGFATRLRQSAETVATAIRIGDPASWERAVRAIRATNGVVTAVTDAEILGAKAAIDAAGVGCEPASAASLAGVRQLAQAGSIGPGERVVAVLTGHMLKDSEIQREEAREGAEVRIVEPNFDALARAITASPAPS